MRVAIIDDGLNPGYAPIPPIAARYTHGPDGVLAPCRSSCDTSSHGTVCAAVLGSICPDVQLVDIRILDAYGAAPIGHLLSALAWCRMNDVQIVHMSLGTLNYHDMQMLVPEIEALLKNGIYIIAAFHNSNIVSWPAGMPGVFGVRCDRGTVLGKGEFAVDADTKFPVENRLIASPPLTIPASNAAAAISVKAAFLLSAFFNVSFFVRSALFLVFMIFPPLFHLYI